MINLRNCIFGFNCTAKWESMLKTDNQNIRHCDFCNKNVYHVSNKNDLLMAIELDRCVAIDVVENFIIHQTTGLIRQYVEEPTESEINIPEFLRKTTEDD